MAPCWPAIFGSEFVCCTKKDTQVVVEDVFPEPALSPNPVVEDRSAVAVLQQLEATVDTAKVEAEKKAHQAEEAVKVGAQAVKIAVGAGAAAVATAVAKGEEKAQQALDKVEDAAEALAAKITGQLIVGFEVGKDRKSVVFSTKDLGFELAARSGCCGKAPALCVARVQKGGQAEHLGVQRGWVVHAIDGREVHGLEEAKKLLAEAAAHLSTAVVV